MTITVRFFQCHNTLTKIKNVQPQTLVDKSLMLVVLSDENDVPTKRLSFLYFNNFGLPLLPTLDHQQKNIIQNFN